MEIGQNGLVVISLEDELEATIGQFSIRAFVPFSKETRQRVDSIAPPFTTHLRRMSNALPSTSLTATVVFLLLFPPEPAAAAAAAAEPDMPITPAPLVLFVMLLCCFACSLKGPLNIALR